MGKQKLVKDAEANNMGAFTVTITSPKKMQREVNIKGKTSRLVMNIISNKTPIWNFQRLMRKKSKKKRKKMKNKGKRKVRKNRKSQNPVLNDFHICIFFFSNFSEISIIFLIRTRVFLILKSVLKLI